MPVRLTPFLVALALASCSTPGRRSADPAARADAVAEGVARPRADSARFADPRNRVAAVTGLVYEYWTCASYTFDSASGLLVRRGRAAGPDTLRAELTPAEFGSVVAEADWIGLWSYPADFGRDETLVLGPDSTYSSVMPSGSYRLDLRAGGRSASVRWSEEITGPLSKGAERLRVLGRQIEEHVGARAAYDQFPELGYFCL